MGAKVVETNVRCECGKRLARYENGVIYLWCKSCKTEIALPLESIPGYPSGAKSTPRANKI